MFWALASRVGDHRQDASCQLQVLEYTSSRQNHVCRGVWSAELHHQCDMADMGLLLAAYFEELRYGALGSDVLRDRKVSGSYSMPLHIFTDSFSIFSYLEAAHVSELHWVVKRFLTYRTVPKRAPPGQQKEDKTEFLAMN